MPFFFAYVLYILVLCAIGGHLVHCVFVVVLRVIIIVYYAVFYKATIDMQT